MVTLVVKVFPGDQSVVYVGDPMVAVACAVLGDQDNLNGAEGQVLLAKVRVAWGKDGQGGLWVAHENGATLDDQLEAPGKAFSAALPREAGAFHVSLPMEVCGNDVLWDHPMG